MLTSNTKQLHDLNKNKIIWHSVYKFPQMTWKSLCIGLSMYSSNEVFFSYPHGIGLYLNDVQCRLQIIMQMETEPISIRPKDALPCMERDHKVCIDSGGRFSCTYLRGIKAELKLFINSSLMVWWKELLKQLNFIWK